MDIHPEGIQVDTVAIHIGVNDLLNYSNQSRTDSLTNNIICMVEKCRNYGVINTFLSRIVFTTRVSLDILIQVHNMISNFCGTNGLYYIENRNIRADCLYKVGLHLLDNEKIDLVNNFIINLNQNFLTTHIHHPPDAFWIRNVFQTVLAILWKQIYRYYRMTGSNFITIHFKATST